MGDVQASLNGMILHDKGVKRGPSEAIDTRGISYNCVAMDALLQEPTVDQPNVMSINIPAAKDSVYFDAEDGVGDIGTLDSEDGGEEAVDVEEVEGGSEESKHSYSL